MYLIIDGVLDVMKQEIHLFSRYLSDTCYR